MNKIKSEYQALKFFSKQTKALFSEDIAKKLRCDRDSIQSMVNWLVSQNFLSSKNEPITNNLSAYVFKITPEGYKRLHELKMEQRLFALTAISVITSVASLLIAIWGLTVG